jgi:hypothetical protein
MSNQNINSPNDKISINDDENEVPSWDPFTPSNDSNNNDAETEPGETGETGETEETEETEEKKENEMQNINPKTYKNDNPLTNNNKLTPLEAVNEFYELKNKYETTNFNKYIKPILKSNKSKREKKSEYSKIPRFPCINCKRNVNTIFKIVHDSENLLHKYIAKCGDLQDPCPLNIEIDYTISLNLRLEIKENINTIEKIKMNIIKEKNNAIFFKDSNGVLNKFEKLTNELKKETEYTGSYIEEYILKNDNPVRAEILNKSIIEFGQGFLLPFKEMVQEYLKTNNELIINNAVKFYKNEMLPKLKEIQELKYEVNIIEYNDFDKTYNLIQQKNIIDKNEIIFLQDNKVINFIKGIKNSSENASKKSKTLRLKPILDTIKGPSRTRKVRPNIEFDITEEEVNNDNDNDNDN